MHPFIIQSSAIALQLLKNTVLCSTSEGPKIIDWIPIEEIPRYMSKIITETKIGFTTKPVARPMFQERQKCIGRIMWHKICKIASSAHLIYTVIGYRCRSRTDLRDENLRISGCLCFAKEIR